MDFQIRSCRPEDAHAIQMLNRDEMGYDHPFSETKKQVNRLLNSTKDLILVAVIDQQIVGYIHANDYDLLYGPRMKNIMGIAVSSNHRGMGIGRALMEEVEAWARADGAAGIRLVSGRSRTDAHAFYHRMGFAGGKEQLNFKKIF